MFFLWEEALHFHLLARVPWGSCFRFLPLESGAVDAYFLYPSTWLEAGLWSRRLCIVI